METETKVSKKLNYIGKLEGYDKWAENFWKQGLTTTEKEIAELLHVSERWVRDNISNNIPFVIYSKKFIYDKIKNKKTTSNATKRICMNDVSDWIKISSKFECQTEVIDMYSYLANANKKEANKILKLYNETFERLGDFYNKGTIPESVFCEIRKNFHISKDLQQNMKITHRSEYKWVELEPFDIFEYERYFTNEGDRSAELYYREAFLNGDIKVTLGKGRVIFVKANQNISKMKMPFVIKKDAKCIVK